MINYNFFNKLSQMWIPTQDKIDEIIAFLKVTQSPKNEIQKDIFKV
jgi:hypothetical protein